MRLFGFGSGGRRGRVGHSRSVVAVDGLRSTVIARSASGATWQSSHNGVIASRSIWSIVLDCFVPRNDRGNSVGVILRVVAGSRQSSVGVILCVVAGSDLLRVVSR